MKVLVYIVCYNAQNYIYDVLKRIPMQYRNDPDIKIMVSDDCSPDNTAETAVQACKELGYTNYEVFKTKVNQGYGGNQKIGYSYACNNNFDYVILLHGDGQYAPEELGNFIRLFEDRPDVVLGSRMLIKKNALKGKMPVLRFVSNIILTKIQNILARTDFAEFHTGYRAYSTEFLKEVPFELNSSDFDFDTDILLQAKLLGKNIKELPIPTFYGQEKSHVKLIKYGLTILATTLKFRLHQMGIGCSMKFRGSKKLVYKDKYGFKYSTHYHLLNIIKDLKPKRILEIASGAGYLGEKLKDEGITITGIDLHAPRNNYYSEFYRENIEQFDWNRLCEERYDVVCLMDVLELLKEPEKLVMALRHNSKLEKSIFIVSVPNVAFFTVRIGLLFGLFNYADRGILDIDHKRLFTYSSIQTLLKECGFKVKKTIPIPPPFNLLMPGYIGYIFVNIFNLLNKILPGLFSFQILKVAEPIPTTTNIIKSSLQRYE